MTDTVDVTVRSGDGEETIAVERGRTLRDALLAHDFPVYGTLSRHANCGGRGLCATCTVEIDPAPALTVRLLDKYVWGQVLPRRASGGE